MPERIESMNRNLNLIKMEGWEYPSTPVGVNLTILTARIMLKLQKDLSNSSKSFMPVHSVLTLSQLSSLLPLCPSFPLRFLFQQHYWFLTFPTNTQIVADKLVDLKSEQEGRNTSRLPSFDNAWSLYIKGTWDFLGLNTYSTQLVFPTAGGSPGWGGDHNTGGRADPSWPPSASAWLKVVPWGFRKLLNWIKNTYGNPEVIVTENGFSDTDSVGLNDTGRVDYYKAYINNLLKAVVLDGCNVTAYTAWSLMDNFEWARGYTERFGIHWVNFTDPERTRIPKESSYVLREIFTNNGFPENKHF